jgi:phosphoserine phosphatase RsbU/P
LKGHLAQAAEIQQSLLPQKMPEFAGYSIAARSMVATEVGGDFYDLITDGLESLYVVLGDASGHGLGSALLARDVVTGLRMGAERDLKITSLIERLNHVIARSMLSTRFVSLFLGELETNGNLFYINAGHIPPWILGAKGTRRLTVGGMILGPVQDSRFKRGFAHLDRGDTLIVVSDGLIERQGADGSEFGEAGIESVARRMTGRSAEEVLDALFAESWDFGGHTAWNDDATALVVTRSLSPNIEPPSEAGT